MGPNIKNGGVHELARQAAAATGKSQTVDHEEALIRLLADYGVGSDEPQLTARTARVHSIVRAYVDTPPGPERAVTDVDDLYDKHTGLPR